MSVKAVLRNEHLGKFKKTQPTLPSWKAVWYEKLAINILGVLPTSWQRTISHWYTRIFILSLSRLFIRPYCWYHYTEANYIEKFKPPNKKVSFTCFQDFFTRAFKQIPTAKSQFVWGCEGNLCHAGFIKNIPFSNVKGQIRQVHHIFGLPNALPDNYYFTNIFLHNKNYHRIHAPLSGTIVRIQAVSGDLVILRPWIYKDNPSIPAFRNERVNIDIQDEEGQIWYLSIVGGPAVSTIDLAKEVQLHAKVDLLQELAVFYLGSTFCMASPKGVSLNLKTNQLVEVGDAY